MPLARLRHPIKKGTPLAWSTLWIVFLLSRALLLGFPEQSHSTIAMNAMYGSEWITSLHERKSFYAEHQRRQLLLGEQQELGHETVEYPPLMITWMSVPAWLIVNTKAFTSYSAWLKQYDLVSRRISAMVDVSAFAALLLVMRILQVPAERCITGLYLYTLLGLSLYAVVYDRTDLIIALLLVTGLAALLAGHPYGALMLLAVAIDMKVIAILVAPIWLIGSVSAHLKPTSFMLHVLRKTGALIGVVLLLFSPYLFFYGIDALQFITYHVHRGVQLESVLANVVLFLRDAGLPARIEHSYGSTNVTLPEIQWAAGASLMFMLLLEIWTYRRFVQLTYYSASEHRAIIAVQHPNLVVLFTALTVCIGLCCSKVLSPQYFVWLLPVVPAVAVQETRYSRVQILFVIVCLGTMMIYPLCFDRQIRQLVITGDHSVSFLGPTGFGLLLLTARNAVLIVLTWTMWQIGRLSSQSKYLGRRVI